MAAANLSAQDFVRDRLDAYFSAPLGPRAERERRARLHRMQALAALPDAALAARGLTREAIPAHVFADLFDL